MNVITNNELRCTIALAALQHVLDPEIGLNVADMGLIYQVDFDNGGKKIDVTMTLSTQLCSMGESITEAVKRALEQAFPEEDVTLTLSFDPPWNYERISEEGKEFLNR